MKEKIPPHNLDAEQSVIGSILIDKEALVKVIEKIRPESFYQDTHRYIMEVAFKLFGEGKPIDLVTVSDELKNNGKLEMIGGTVYLSELINSVPTSANIAHYAVIVEEKFVLRSLLSAGSEIIASSFDDTQDVEEVLDNAEKLVIDVAQKRIKQGFIKIKDVLMPVMDKIEKIYDKETNILGIPSGFSDIDGFTSGFQLADLIIIAARPSMGKTALALNICQEVAIKQKIPVALYSLEMAKEQLAQRILCSEAEIDATRLKTGSLKEHEWKKLGRAIGRLSEAPIYIDDTASITPIELRAKARRLQMEHGLGLIIIDYLQLMHGGRRRSENRVQEISEISRSLKAVGRELNVPVIALSQLSRAVEQRQDRIPRLSDLRESGEIEQTADVVMFIHRDDYYNPASQKENMADIIIAKQRNGPTGIVELVFRKEITKFSNREKHYGQ